MKDFIKSNWLWIVLLIPCVITIWIMAVRLQKANENVADLNMLLSAKDSIERIDKQTIKKQALSLSDIQVVIEQRDRQILDLMRERNQKPKVYTKIVERIVVDSIPFKADTTIKIGDDEWAVSVKDTAWYYIKARWTCFPTYRLNLDRVAFYERLQLIEYESDVEKGVYVRSLNPYSVMDSVSYFVQKPKEKNWHFGIGAIFETQLKDIYPIFHGGYKGHNIIAGWNVRSVFDPTKYDGRKFILGYSYQVSW